MRSRRPVDQSQILGLLLALTLAQPGCGNVTVDASQVDATPGFVVPTDTVDGDTANANDSGKANTDAATSDSSSSDAATSDSSSSDAAITDSADPDSADPDTHGPDTVAVDTASSDADATDAVPNDTTQADTAAADTAAADTAAADTTQADTTQADTAANDATPGDTTEPCETKGNEICNGADDDCDGQTDEQTCDDGIACTIDVCGGFTGCSHQSSGAPCDDGDPCTTGDSCTLEGCKPDGATNCADSDICTQDFCKPGVGCGHAPAFGPCDDGNACTTNDSCGNDGCSGKAKDCDDNNPCTTDTCKGTTACSHVANTGVCDDDDACTTGETCTGGSCKGGKLKSCDDGNPCTDEICATASGCIVTANTAPCDDGDACTVGDLCANSACKPGKVADCDDSNACTIGEACSGGVCGGGKPVTCDDGNVCTVDACKPASGCATTVATDGTACPGGSCSAGVCKAQAVCKAGELSGDLTIGPKGTYTTFALALDALTTKGVCAPTTFTVAGGTYTEGNGFLFKPIPGAGEAAPVRFEAAAGQTVRLVGASGGSNSGIVRIDGKTSWLTLVGFELDGNVAANKIGTSYSGPIHFGIGGGQSHVRIENFYIHDFGPNAWSSTTYIGGVYMQISSSTESIEFIGNRFENLDPGSSFSTQGAIATRNGVHTNMRIVGNTFIGIGHMAAIRFRNGNGWSGLVVANNVFIIGDGLSAMSWYSTNFVIDNPLFAHNSVLLGKGASAIDGKTSGGATDVRNNIVFAPTSGKFVDIALVGVYGHNCLNGVNSATGANNVGPDVIAAPNFVSSTAPYDLHLQPNSPCLNKADLLPAVPLDIDGEKRTSPADIGADERL